MRDTRILFDSLCACKTTFEAAPLQNVNDERMRILLGLPRKQVPWETSAFDDVFYNPGEPTRAYVARQCPLEWVVERMGTEEGQLQYFYVNNEGYAYCRYMFRFEPRPV